MQGEQKFTSATSKPAPFAEKKSAKDAAPGNSMSGLIGLRCDAGGFATRRYAQKKILGGIGLRCDAEGCATRLVRSI